MGLNYVRQDQTVPGADRLSAGPCCNAARAAFWERRRRNWGAVSRAEKHGRRITELPALGFTTAACCNAPGGVQSAPLPVHQSLHYHFVLCSLVEW